MANSNENTATKLTDLIVKRGSKGEILYAEDELIKMFTDAECTTKTDMIMHLYGLGHAANDIAKTLLKYNILTEKSYYQMVRNTIDRVTSKKEKKAS